MASMDGSRLKTSRPFANIEWPKVLRTDDSSRRRKSARGCTVVWMLTSSSTRADGVGSGLLVVRADQHQVDVGLVPHLVVGQAAAEHCGQDVTVLADRVDHGVERRLEAGPRDGRHGLVLVESPAPNHGRMRRRWQETVRRALACRDPARAVATFYLTRPNN